MREIKFRAWDKTTRQMVCGVSPHIREESGRQHIILEHKTEYSAGSKVQTYEEWTKAFELMQYTGLKDKNGKEIYEGDIVNTVSEPPFILHEVTYVPGRFVLKDNLGTYPFLHFAGKHYEVIGNIYENPELLKEL